jgi:hypothetical protein
VKLFVIGNGFDRGHGLPTGYWDFRTYLENLYPEFLYAFEQHYYIYPKSDDEAKKKLLWNELESNLANIDEDVIIEDAVSIDMNLESGDVGIEDTLYDYFTDEYKYIQKLAKYLKQWVRTIRIRGVQQETDAIKNSDDAIYITFNYTAVLETVYGIDEKKIIHIHGSLRQRDVEPVLGHGNTEILNDIQERLQEAENKYDEKEMSICRVINNYYRHTFKDINRYIYKLNSLSKKKIDEIIVIGHSVAGVDIPYFKYINMLSNNSALWKVYYYSDDERKLIRDRLINCGIKPKRLDMKPAAEFYNLI